MKAMKQILLMKYETLHYEAFQIRVHGFFLTTKFMKLSKVLKHKTFQSKFKHFNIEIYKETFFNI
jgi:hypothetical protein